MAKYDKDKIKEKLTTNMIFEIVYEFGGEPRISDFGFIAATICHNHAGEGSHKLYYYENTSLFRCYTGCDNYFDIFELITKVKNLSGLTNWGLYDSVKWIIKRYGWYDEIEEEESFIVNPAWKIFERYEKINNIAISKIPDLLPEYDSTILDNLSYPLIADWIDEGITPQVLKFNRIGYYPSGEQITIPHFDIHNRFIGLRGRALGQQQAERYGKYRPLIVGKQMYNHPLGLNLYNLNHSHPQIQKAKTAIIFEGEKSALLYQSYFGIENDISVACCGSSVSSMQMSLLFNLNVKEIVVAFDKQFQKKNDDEFKQLVKNLKNIHKRYGQYATISFMFDTQDILPYKASPIDCGPNIFLNMFKQRIIL